MPQSTIESSSGELEQSLLTEQGDEGLAKGTLTADALQAIFDRYQASIAVLDSTGIIKCVNHAWKKYFSDNGGQDSTTWTKVNYLEVCENATRENNKHA